MNRHGEVLSNTQSTEILLRRLIEHDTSAVLINFGGFRLRLELIGFGFYRSGF